MLKRGRKRMEADERRGIVVKSRVNSRELSALDARRGKMSRGAYLRAAALDRAPRPIPQINICAWRDLGRALGNLASISTAMRSGEYIELSACRNAVVDLRNAILGARDLAMNDENDEAGEE